MRPSIILLAVVTVALGGAVVLLSERILEPRPGRSAQPTPVIVSGSPIPVPTVTQPVTSTYHNAQYGFVLSYPESWSATENPDGTQDTVYFSAPTGDRIILSFDSRPRFTRADLDSSGGVKATVQSANDAVLYSFAPDATTGDSTGLDIVDWQLHGREFNLLTSADTRSAEQSEAAVLREMGASLAVDK